MRSEARRRVGGIPSSSMSSKSLVAVAVSGGGSPVNDKIHMGLPGKSKRVGPLCVALAAGRGDCRRVRRQLVAAHRFRTEPSVFQRALTSNPFSFAGTFVLTSIGLACAPGRGVRSTAQAKSRLATANLDLKPRAQSLLVQREHLVARRTRPLLHACRSTCFAFWGFRRATSNG